MNLYQLMPRAASVPNTVERAADEKAMSRLLKSERHRFFESNSSALYHTKDNPVKSLPLPALNE